MYVIIVAVGIDVDVGASIVDKDIADKVVVLVCAVAPDATIAIRPSRLARYQPNASKAIRMTPPMIRCLRGKDSLFIVIPLYELFPSEIVHDENPYPDQ
ncbi:MAG: hypothetical protein AMXMBFR60_06120 [Chloroflexota bacterium]